MFFDLDILKRRGGKFGVIWLIAAHQRLKFEGKESTRQDRALALNVKIGKTVDDILDYVKLQKASAAACQPDPRFSLYLSAMLTHGAVLLHHFQVKNDIAQMKLVFSQKTKRKPQDAGNDVLGRNIGEVIAQDQAIEEVVERERAGVQPELVDPNLLQSLYTLQNSSMHHLTTNDRITLREPEPLVNPPDDFGSFGEAYGFNSTADSFDLLNENSPFLEPQLNDEEFPPVQEERGATSQDRSRGLSRSSSKRGRDDHSDPETSPSKMRRPAARETIGVTPRGNLMDQQDPIDQDPIPEMQQLILDPGVAVPDPRAVQRPRRRRLMVDDPMYIPVERMRDAIGDYRDTLRAENAFDDRVDIAPNLHVAALELLDRPNIRAPAATLANLCRPIVTPSLDEDSDDEEHQDNVHLQVGNEEEIGAAAADPVLLDGNAMPQPDGLPQFPDGDEMDVPPVRDLINNMEAEPEMARPPTREVSYSGSLPSASANISRLDASGLDRSRGSHAPQPELRPPVLETVEEASVEMSRSQNKTAGRSLVVDATIVAPPHRSFDPPPVLSEENEMDMGDVPVVQPMAAAERGPDFAVPDQRPRGYYVVDARDQRYPIPNPPSPHESDEKVDEELINRIETLSQEVGGVVTFRQLMPTETNTKEQAFAVFQSLLRLDSADRVTLKQDGRGPIFITLEPSESTGSPESGSFSS